MKKLTTISLFVFGVVVSAILTAGLVFYQNNKTNKPITKDVIPETINTEKVSEKITPKNEILNKVNPIIKTEGIVLNITEISKHNKSNDCWMLINGKVYDITSYFGLHPGGNSTMSATCGKDATDAYKTQDPNATSSGNKSEHSRKAYGLLDEYYIGDVNQTKI